VAGSPAESRPGDGARMLDTFFQFIVGIAMIVQAFNAKSIIEDHCSPEDRSEPFAEPVKLSGS
jgi:hypothetical protein